MTSLVDGTAAADVSALKKDLRSQYRKKLNDLELDSAGVEKLHKNLKWLLGTLVRSNVAVYRSFGTEAPVPQPEFFNEISNIAYPRVEGEELEFYKFESSTQWIENEYGIEEPSTDSQVISLSDCEAVVVPGLAFDHKGGRLGRGKGFYDRALKEYTGVKIGFCFHEQLAAEELPRAEFDKKVDYLVTEKTVVQCVA